MVRAQNQLAAKGAERLAVMVEMYVRLRQEHFSNVETNTGGTRSMVPAQIRGASNMR